MRTSSKMSIGVILLMMATFLHFQLCQTSDTKMVIEMPIVQPKEKDEYICFAQELQMDELYLHLAETKVNSLAVHHAGIGFCEELVSTDPIWSCTNMTGRLCTGAAVSVGGWDDLAENDGVFHLPKDVGIRIGRKSSLRYLILEVHYRGPLEAPLNRESSANVTLNLATIPPKYQQQMLLLSNTGYIPSRSDHGYFSEVACPWTGPSVHVYGYTLHTHHHGLLVEGFLIRNKRWIVLGSQITHGRTKRNFEIPGGPMEVKKGDILAARCLYINNNDTAIEFGHGIDTEMCNFMLDFAYDPVHEKIFDRILSCDEESPKFSFCSHYQTRGMC